jgi:hypothetical protein
VVPYNQLLVAVCARRIALNQTAGGELKGDSESLETSQIMAQQPAIALMNWLGVWNVGGGR